MNCVETTCRQKRERHFQSVFPPTIRRLFWELFCSKTIVPYRWLHSGNPRLLALHPGTTVLSYYERNFVLFCFRCLRLAGDRLITTRILFALLVKPTKNHLRNCLHFAHHSFQAPAQKLSERLTVHFICHRSNRELDESCPFDMHQPWRNARPSLIVQSLMKYLWQNTIILLYLIERQAIREGDRGYPVATEVARCNVNFQGVRHSFSPAKYATAVAS